MDPDATLVETDESWERRRRDMVRPTGEEQELYRQAFCKHVEPYLKHKH